MKKPVNHPYEKFLKALHLTSINSDKRWGGLSFTNVGHVSDVWNAMSRRSKSKLVSDSRWNHYPLMSYTKGSKKRFGAVIRMIVDGSLSGQRDDDLKSIINSSNGIWAVFMLDSAPSSARVKMAKRLRKSPDHRVRTRCAKILPARLLHTMLDDKHYSVRSSVIQRLGIDNCYKAFIPPSLGTSRSHTNWWWNNWIGRQAIALAEPEEFAFLIDQAKSLSQESLMNAEVEVNLVALISRMSPEEALYFMNLKDVGNRVSSALERKLKHT